MERPIEIAIVSGKGGTGKTVLASSLARLTESRIVADCDVDGPNMHLLANPTVLEERTLAGHRIAILDAGACTRCGECAKACRFGAVRERDVPEGWLYSIDLLSCEGCAACTMVCPADALHLTDSSSATWYVSDSSVGPLIHPALAAGQRNAGELVRVLRREARRTAARGGLRYIIIDGPAGIGATAIASVIGTALAVLVAEPTISGIYDLGRMVDLLERLGIKAVGVVNQSDLNPEIASDIAGYLSRKWIPLLGSIPYSDRVNEAISAGKFVVDVAGDDPAVEEIKKVVARILEAAAAEARGAAGA